MTSPASFRELSATFFQPYYSDNPEKGRIEDDIKTMDYRTRIHKCLTLKSIHTRYLLIDIEHKIISAFEDQLVKCLFTSMENYSKN